MTSMRNGFETLMQRVAEGDDDAAWEVVNRYSSNILRTVRRHMPSEIRQKVDSSDIVQSVWKSLMRRSDLLGKIETAEQFVKCIAQMARTKVFETHRHYTAIQGRNIRREQSLAAPTQEHGERAEIGIASRGETPSTIAQMRECWQIAVESAGKHGAGVVKLRLQGMTHEQIAERLGISVGTVRRTIDKLFDSLSDWKDVRRRRS